MDLLYLNSLYLALIYHIILYADAYIDPPTPLEDLTTVSLYLVEVATEMILALMSSE